MLSILRSPTCRHKSDRDFVWPLVVFEAKLRMNSLRSNRLIRMVLRASDT